MVEVRELLNYKNTQSQKDEQPEMVEFEPDDIVLIANKQKPVGVARSLYPRWSGPYVILRRLGTLTYEVQARSKVKPRVVPARLMLKYDPYMLDHESWWMLSNA